MASGLAALANSISNLVRGIGAELGILSDNSGKLYPKDFGPDASILASHNNENWNKLPFPYTFSVIQLGQNGNNIGFEDFSLPIAPSKISLSDSPSISIRPVQGGTVVTHSGNRYKKLTIEGTTGINPNRGMTGVDATTGRAIAKPQELKFMSGYEVANELKNYFRSYYQTKAQATTQDEKDARLVFKNFKDGEFYIIEILDCSFDRGPGFLYNYKIDAKVIGLFKYAEQAKSFFESLDAGIDKIVSKIDVARGIFLGAQEVLRQVESSYDSTVLEPMRKVGLAAKAFGGISLTAADVGNKITKNTATAKDSLNIMKVIRTQQDQYKSGESAFVPQSILNVKMPADLNSAIESRGNQILIDLGPALYDIPLSQMPKKTQDAMPDEIMEASNNPRSFYETLLANLKRIKENAEDKFNLGSSAYDSIFNRTTTLSGDSSKQVTDQEYEVLGAFNDAIININTLICYPDLFKTDFERRIATIEDKFSESLPLQALPAVKQITLPGNTDLEQIALDELGDPVRWVEIAELNDLNYPYIVQNQTDTRTNIKRPGDTLLIPQELKFGLSDAPEVRDIPSTVGLSATEKSFGTDLKVTEQMDLDLANNGDLAVVSGLQNMAQAIVLRIGYERGQLKNHPTLGVGLMVGQKFLSLEQVRDNLLATLTQDKRISGISNVALLKQGSALYMSFDVSLTNVDQRIPLTIKL